MRKGKYAKPVARKPIALILALVLVVSATIGGTIAWLTDTTDKIENIFTVGNVYIDLTETKENFKMIPGHTIEKDPRVTVEEGSEDCWLFVEVTESTTLKLTDYIKYAVNTNTAVTTDGVTHGGWTQGTGTNGVPTNVYYRAVTGATADQVFAVLGGGTYTFDGDNYVWENDEVLTLPEVTKDMMAAVTTGATGNQPKLSFTAYACQYMKNNDTPFEPAEAWLNVNPATP